MYIENEIYHMANNKFLNLLNDYQFIELNMSKWDDFFKFCEILRNKGY